MPRGSWPSWWDWELELSPHLLSRMEDRRFTEIDLRDMMNRATSYYQDIEPGRWVIVTRYRRQRWEVVVEPDFSAEMLVVITAYSLREG